MSDSPPQVPGRETGSDWLVYVIEAGDGTLYTGITTDLARRWQQHASGRGARYLRGRDLRAVVFVEAGHDRASASRREAAIKKLSRQEKLTLIAGCAQKKPPADAGG
jgi:putative endonuclease